MYKCGWNGCEKAYGTLNHLNAHVTMQGHGPKRTPDGMPPVIYAPSYYVANSIGMSGEHRGIFAEANNAH